jgi:tRNA A-37 threonylcarbamoyl transferase component Bud32
MNALLANDPALPQRDVLVDETVMAEYLSRLVAGHGDFGINSCERLRTKYRVGASLRVLYKVSGNGQSYRIAARAFPRTQPLATRFHSMREIHAPELNAIFWIFPHDRKIKTLNVLNHLPAGLRDIQGHEWVQSRVVGHAPEKSVTVQCLDAARRLLGYAKIYAGDEGRAIYDAYQEIHAALEAGMVQLRIPRALSYSAAHHLLLLESVPGVPLSVLELADRVPAYRRLGEALRKLHDLSPPATTARSTRLTPSGLARAAAIIAQARPEVAHVVQQLACKLIAGYEKIAQNTPVLLHGDLHPKNVLVDNEGLSLLDFDQAARGAAALDLAGVIAGLHCEACLDLLTKEDCSSLITAFVKGYGGNAASLRWYVAAALLEERALRAVTRIRFGGLQKLPEILTRAAAVLNGGIGAH